MVKIKAEISKADWARFNKALSELDKKSQNQLLRRLTVEGAKELQKEAKERAPVRTGALKRSLVVRTRKRNTWCGSWTQADPKATFIDTVTGAKIKPSKYLHLIQYGTRHSAANPFLITAFNNKVGKIEARAIAAIRAFLAKS
jgi:HK97 gp10 family phage protein